MATGKQLCPSKQISKICFYCVLLRNIELKFTDICQKRNTRKYCASVPPSVCFENKIGKLLKINLERPMIVISNWKLQVQYLGQKNWCNNKQHYCTFFVILMCLWSIPFHESFSLPRRLFSITNIELKPSHPPTLIVKWLK